MKVCSYNVMMNDINSEYRMKEIILLLNDFDVILLQEVPKNWYNLFIESLIEYNTSDLFVSPIEKHGYGNMIFVSKKFQVKFKYIPFVKTFMGRGMSIATVEETTFISTHLESLQSDQFKLIRKVQADQLNIFVSECLTECVIGIDCNMHNDLNIDGCIDVFKKYKANTWHGDRFFDVNKHYRYSRMYVSENINIETREIHMYSKLSDHDMMTIRITKNTLC